MYPMALLNSIRQNRKDFWSALSLLFRMTPLRRGRRSRRRFAPRDDDVLRFIIAGFNYLMGKKDRIIAFRYDNDISFATNI